MAENEKSRLSGFCYCSLFYRITMRQVPVKYRCHIFADILVKVKGGEISSPP